MASYEAAKEAVVKIAKEHGHLDDKWLEIMEQINPDMRREVEYSHLAKDKLAGHAIITYELSNPDCFALLTFHR